MEKGYKDILLAKYNKMRLSKTEVAHELGISEATLTRRIVEDPNYLPHTKEKRIYYFSLLGLSEELELLDRWVA